MWVDVDPIVPITFCQIELRTIPSRSISQTARHYRNIDDITEEKSKFSITTPQAKLQIISLQLRYPGQAHERKYAEHKYEHKMQD